MVLVRIVTMSGTEFVYGYNSEQLFVSRSDVIVWVSKSRFTHPTIIKMPGAVRSFCRRAFYNSTLQKYWLSVGTQIWLCTSTYQLPIWGNMSYSDDVTLSACLAEKNEIDKYRRFFADGTRWYCVPYKRDYELQKRIKYLYCPAVLFAAILQP